MAKNQTVKSRIVGIFFVIIFFVSFAIGIIIIFATDYDDKEPVHELTGWTYVDHHKTIHKVTEPTKLNVKPGKTLVLTKRLEEKVSSKDIKSTFGFYTVCQSVNVKLNGISLYQRKMEPNPMTGRATPSGWNYVRIGAHNPGDVLTVELVSPYTMSSGNVPVFYVGSETALVRHSYSKSMVSLFLDGMIFFLGAFWLIHFFYMKYYKANYSNSYTMGLFAITVAVWLYSGADYRPSLFLTDASMCYLAESTFLLVPVSYAFMLSKFTRGKIKKYVKVLVNLSIINMLTCQVLQLLGIRDIIDLILISHILIVVLIVTTFFHYHGEISSGRLSWKSTEVIGNTILLLSVGFELAKIYQSTLENTGMIVRFGLIIYVCLEELWMMEQEKNKELKALENENRLKEIRLKLLAGQIQPHFIYNTLGSIQGLIKIDTDEAVNLTYIFSKYLRENVEFVDLPMMIPFQKELEHIQTYVDIEKIRFEERVSVIYEIEDTNFKVPSLSVQPLVENAIKHGICKRDDGGKVRLVARKQDGNIQIIVEDDGVGFDTKKVLAKDYPSVGLKNSIYRWEELNQAKVTIESRLGVGTKITIMFNDKDNT